MDKSKKGKNFWGPPFWATIHSICASYKPENAEVVKIHMSTYTKLLPCEICREHLHENFLKFPIDRYLTSNHELFFWSYLLHDAVNLFHNTHKSGEPKKISPHFDDVKAFYFRALSDECKECRM